MRDPSGRARQTLITRGPSRVYRGKHLVATERSWTQDARHLIGTADSVMLEDYTNESAFLSNLETRFENENIYTYIINIPLGCHQRKIHNLKCIGFILLKDENKNFIVII